MKANPIQTAINGGEFSPRMDARVDINQYANAAARLENYLVAPQGGMFQRPGSRFINETSGVNLSLGTSSFDYAGEWQFGDGSANNRHHAIKISATSTGTVQSVNTHIQSVATSFNAQASVYSDSSGSPGTQVGSNSDSVSIAASGEKIFTWSSGAPTVTSGTDYWIVISDVSGGSGSAQMRLVDSNSSYVSGYSDTITSISSLLPEELDYGIGVVISTDNSTPQLIPFKFSTEQSYILEFGHGNINFYTNQGVLSGAQNAPSVTNGTFDSDISGWTDWSAGTGSISHTTYRGNGVLEVDGDGGANEGRARQSITIDSGDIYKTHVIHFQVIGSSGDGLYFQLSDTAADASIYPKRFFRTGYHTVSFQPGTTQFHIEFIRDSTYKCYVDNIKFISTSAFSMESPYDSNDLFNIQYAGSADLMYLASGNKPIHALQRKGVLDWSLRELVKPDGPYLDKNTSATTADANGTSGEVIVTFSDTAGINGGVGFSEDDLGRLFRQEHGADAGWGVIYNVVSTTVVYVRLFSDLSAHTANTNWWLGAWSGSTGHPSAVTFYEQRLVFAATENQPQTVWMSQAGDLENFRPDSYVSSALTVEDDDAIDFTLSSTEVNKIQWISHSRSLLIGTSGGEWAVSSNGATITPTDIDAKQQSHAGSANIQPVNINNHVVFVQRDKQTVNDLNFSFEDDGFGVSDLTLPANHIGIGETTSDTSGFKQMAYQKEPDSIVWAVRNDGQLCALTFKPGELVAGWSRHILGGSGTVESVACIPGENGGGRTIDSGNRTEVWMIVKRTINGSTKLYVEMLEDIVRTDVKPSFGTNTFVAEDAFYVDSGLTYDGTSTSTLSGLDHLEGETVYVNGNGADLGSYTVSSGSITLSTAVTKAQVGLLMVPRYLSLKMNAGARAGTSVGKKKRVYAMSFVLLDSYDFKFGDGNAENDSSLYHTVNIEVDDVGGVQPLYTGEVFQEFCGPWHRDPRISIRGDVGPLPTNFLALAPEIQTNDVK